MHVQSNFSHENDSKRASCLQTAQSFQRQKHIAYARERAAIIVSFQVFYCSVEHDEHDLMFTYYITIAIYFTFIHSL